MVIGVPQTVFLKLVQFRIFIITGVVFYEKET